MYHLCSAQEVNHSPAVVRLKPPLLASLKVTEAMAYKGSQEREQSNPSAENRECKKRKNILVHPSERNNDYSL